MMCCTFVYSVNKFDLKQTIRVLHTCPNIFRIFDKECKQWFPRARTIKRFTPYSNFMV